MADETLTKRAPYHHGNLPGALIAAAHDLLDEAGIEALTLRAVAQRVGVTHAAPYRHFRDKAALVAAVAGRVADTLAEELLAAGDIVTAAARYVQFAKSHPASYAIMFTGQAEHQLVAALRKLLPGGEPNTATAIVALCHGLATLSGHDTDVESLARTTTERLTAP